MPPNNTTLTYVIVRSTKVIATADSLETPNINMPTKPGSTTPIPPGVGNTDKSAPANATKTACSGVRDNPNARTTQYNRKISSTQPINPKKETTKRLD